MKDLDRLLSTSLGEVLEALAEKLLDRTVVSEVHRLGPHTRTVYTDGREMIHTQKSYPTQGTYISAYDIMRLGGEIRDLHPKRLSPWQAAGIGVGLAGLVPVLGAWWAAHDAAP
jgi:hypothetical protein